LSLTWRKVTLFGLNIPFPFLARIIFKINDAQRDDFKQFCEGMANCETCHRLFNTRFWNRFILHLQDTHKIEQGHSIIIAERIGKRLLYAKRLHREKIAKEAIAND